jgi:hypothetical protein
MTDVREREPTGGVRREAFPRHRPSLAAAPRRATPEPTEAIPEGLQRSGVAGNAIISGVPQHHCAQVGALLRKRLRHAPPQLGLHRAELGAQPLPHRLTLHSKTPAPRLHADVREAEKIERLRLAQAPRR